MASVFLFQTLGILGIVRNCYEKLGNIRNHYEWKEMFRRGRKCYYLCNPNSVSPPSLHLGKM